MTNQAYFPLDFDKLSKGDQLTLEQIEQALDTKRDNPSFQFLRMGLVSRIESELRERGVFVTCCVRDDGIRILTDAEAVDYNHASFEQGVRRLVRAHGRMTRIDRSALTDEQRSGHDRLVAVQAPQVLALKAERRKSFLRPHVRQDPTKELGP